ncbi:hypothetical protein ccbrp13_32690 [Ktedonobacteria bacterium brp13]|nr:hypothetical protein ccbrp13_32690 [Ktedonobacteria bacterium brp13]
MQKLKRNITKDTNAEHESLWISIDSSSSSWVDVLDQRRISTTQTAIEVVIA